MHVVNVQEDIKNNSKFFIVSSRTLANRIFTTRSRRPVTLLCKWNTDTKQSIASESIIVMTLCGLWLSATKLPTLLVTRTVNYLETR